MRRGTSVAAAPDRRPDPSRVRYRGQRGLAFDASLPAMTSFDHPMRRSACSATLRRAALAALALAALPLFAPARALASAPRVVKGPYLTELDDHGVVVRFQL